MEQGQCEGGGYASRQPLGKEKLNQHSRVGARIILIHGVYVQCQCQCLCLYFIGNIHGHNTVRREVLMHLGYWACDNYLKDPFFEGSLEMVQVVFSTSPLYQP